MIYKISPMELFLATCYSCENYKHAKKFIRTKTTFPKVYICFECRLGEYSNFSPSGKFNALIPEEAMLKVTVAEEEAKLNQSLEKFKEGNRVIIGGHPRKYRYAKLVTLLPDHKAFVKIQKDGKGEIVDLIHLIKVENDGLEDRQRLIKLYHRYFKRKWSKEDWEKYQTWIDECL